MEGGSPTPHKSSEDLEIPQLDGNISVCSIDSSDDENSENENYVIPVIITSVRLPKANLDSRGPPGNIVIKHKSRKVLAATRLPVVVNLNPRSVYNKKEEFKTMMEQLDVDVCTMSESWDREEAGLETVIMMDNSSR